ncbi:MAG TPA: hypothetical protein VNX01_09420 [Bacteroidia bacterium]|jgi:hypothetical protein|nr:hypothetical protein [Bacteroidia bacterium]
MKTFNICSDCYGQHSWREIDYDNVLYVSLENAISLTLCPTCVSKFSAAPKNSSTIIKYKQKINSVLEGKSKYVTANKTQNAASLNWGLFF